MMTVAGDIFRHPLAAVAETALSARRRHRERGRAAPKGADRRARSNRTLSGPPFEAGPAGAERRARNPPGERLPAPPAVPDPSRPRKPPRLRRAGPAPVTEADFAEFEREVAAAAPEAAGGEDPPAPERPRSAAAVLREAQAGREIEGERCLSVRGMTQAQARSSLEGFLRRMRGAGVRCVKVIHGKGNRSDGEPVLRRMAPEWLAEWKPELVAGYEPVRRERKGGSGALFVALTPPASRGARGR